MSINPRIGIVSGTGPLAGADVLTKIFEIAAKKYGAKNDADYPEIVLINKGVEGIDSTGNINEAFKEELISIVGELEQKHSNIIGIACNTAHMYFNEIKTNNQTVLINLLDQVALEASKQQKKHLLLTSRTFKNEKLYYEYMKKHGVDFVDATQSDQKRLDDIIGLVIACKLEQAGALLGNLLRCKAEKGTQSVILGCTELPIVFSNTYVNGLNVIDSSYVLAESLADKYYELLLYSDDILTSDE